MYQTIAMEVKPFAAVNGPPPSVPAGPGSNSAAPAAAEQPPPPPANASNSAGGAAAAAPSAGPASPHDVSQGEDATNGHSSSRRPGNLWTAEDREDMFNRRENGEGWETICADYPNRSRHAMQQQYSMMKKQKALADGTWASNRRGRKRRNPAPERTPAAAKRSPDADEQMTEADDFEEPNSDDTEVYDDSGAKMANGRPNPLMRSSTEPAKSSRQRNTQSASAGVTPSRGNRAASQQADPDPTYTTGRQSKKRRLSGDQASNVQVSTPSDAGDYQPSNVMLDYDEVMALLRKGVETGRIQRRNWEQERVQRQNSYAAALGRANRRAAEAHDRFSWSTYEHGENVKKLRGEAALVLKDKVREHTEAMEALAAEHEEERRVYYQQAAAQANTIEELQKENKMLKMDPGDRERAMIEQIDRLKADKEALEAAKLEWEATAKTEPSVIPTAAHTNGDVVAANLEHLAPLESSVYGNSKLFTEDFDRIASMVSKFHEEFDDLGHKRTVQYLVDIVALKDAAVAKASQLTTAVQNLHETFVGNAKQHVGNKANEPAGSGAAHPVSQQPVLRQSSPPVLPAPPAISESPAPPSISVEGPTPNAGSSSPANHDATVAEVPPTSSPPKQGPDAPLPSIPEERAPAAAMVVEPPASEKPDVEMKDEDPKAAPQPGKILPHPLAASESADGIIPLPSATPLNHEESTVAQTEQPIATPSGQAPTNASGDLMEQ